jgi:hypothetical protein
VTLVVEVKAGDVPLVVTRSEPTVGQRCPKYADVRDSRGGALQCRDAQPVETGFAKYPI